MSKLLTIAVSALSLISIITIPQAARAAVSCESNTASNYSNGSLASCVLSVEANIGLSNNYFACKQKESISFDEKGQFKSCTLARNLQIRTGNKVTNCLADGRVDVSIASTGIQSVSCSRIAAN
ncbi:hypothetical protein [Synechocystis sp. PCC 7509]|uniref:hypothetical protein n=1 Tax=Synechocystis sp. PCC 7509 TaxID=927677 RepID=UPI0002AC3DB4|nr:hypothetical protein [Synechocystis sp. PCC 7509]